MQAEIITIGDEILIGQIVDTNSAYLASELHRIGVAVYQISSVQDDRQHILKALEEAESRADIILLTGGLGPTKDDITKHTLCEFFGDRLVENMEVLEHVEYLFRTFISTPISDLNRKQALVPSRAEVLHNQYGTAPGIWMQGDKAVFVSLPGVPFEMKRLFQDQVRPKIVSSFSRPVLLHRTLITYGLGESAIAERLSEWEESLPSHIRLAYLPNLGRVRLRISGRGTDLEVLEKELEKQTGTLKTYINDILFGEEDGEPLEETLQKLFSAKNATLAVADSDNLRAPGTKGLGGNAADVAVSLDGDAHSIHPLLTGNQASRKKTLGREQAAVAGGLVAAPGAAHLDRLAGHHRPIVVPRVQDIVSIENPRHGLLIGIQVGRGDILVGPEFIEQLGGKAPGDTPQFALAELLGVAHQTALGAAERHVDQRALPGHQLGQRNYLVHGHVGVVANTPLAGPEYAIVNHPVTLEALHAVVVHFHREVDHVDALGLLEEIDQATLQSLYVLRSAIELDLADRDRI